MTSSASISQSEPASSSKLSTKKFDLDRLNRKYKALTPEQRIRELYVDFEDVLFTSSFGTTAVLLLHLFYKQGIRQSVHFIDTTYHFKETIAYKQTLTELLGLHVINVKPEKWKNKLTLQSQLWKSHPDLCCSINKVEPLDGIKGDHEVWVSGLMAWQNDSRKSRDIFEEKNGLIKFYPIIDLTEEEANDYIAQNRLPIHPLKPLGYESIGCKHCTLKGSSRSGRWAGKTKTECGLHTA